MKTFTATTPQEKWIKFHFDSKANAMKKLNLTRPTIDKMCKSKKTFYKHLLQLCEASGCSAQEIINDLQKWTTHSTLNTQKYTE